MNKEVTEEEFISVFKGNYEKLYKDAIKWINKSRELYNKEKAYGTETIV